MIVSSPVLPVRLLPWRFFLLTFAFSWLVWIPVAIMRRQADLLAIALGGCGPSLVGITLTYLARDPVSTREFWARAGDVRRIRPAWYAVIFLVFPFLVGAALLADAATGGRPPTLGGALHTLSHPLSLALFVVIMLVGGPLSEELGWRGYALDRLQARWNPVAASLVLGAIWALWHVPLFFMAGTTQNAMGFASPQFALFFIKTIALAVIMTWVFNHTGRSTLGAILLHFMNNFTITLVTQLRGALPERTDAILTLLYGLAATVALSDGSMRRRLAPQPDEATPHVQRIGGVGP